MMSNRLQLSPRRCRHPPAHEQKYLGGHPRRSLPQLALANCEANYDNGKPMRSSRIVPRLNTHRAREPLR